MRALTAIQSTPWLITADALAQIVSIAQREDLNQVLAEAIRAERENLLATRAGQPLDDTRSVTLRDGVAIVSVTGPIFRYANLFTRFSGGTATGLLARDIQVALDDPSVTALLFHFDSPGGEATGIHELGEQIYAARGRKPLISYVGGYAASAAYWLAAATDQIVVDATARVGSIGAVLTVANPDKASGRTVDIVSSQGPRKNMTVATDEGRAQLQQLADALAAVFVARVAQYRGVEEETVLADFGQGGILVGQAAIDVGLADRLGSFEGTLAALAQRAADRTPRLRPAAYQEYTTMDWKALWGGFFAAAKEEGADMSTPETPPSGGMQLTHIAEPLRLTASTPQASAESVESVESAELAKLREQVAAMQQRERAAQAQAWAAGHVSGRRLAPAEREQASAAYAQALADDEAQPLASGSRAALLDGMVAQRPALLTREQLPADTASLRVLPSARSTEAAALDQDREEAKAYAARVNGKGGK